MSGSGVAEVTCPGYCCAAFYLPTTYAQMQDKKKRLRDGDQIAGMIVPLTPKEARERHERFGGGGAEQFKWKYRGHHFTCKHWDEETKLCTIYPDRPDMCRDFPYGDPCPFNCGFDGGMPTDERTKIREEEWLNQWKAYRAKNG